MNRVSRRSFIVGLASLPVAGIALGKEALPAPVARKASVTGGNMILVCGTEKRARAIHAAMGNPINVHPVGAGGSLTGRGANLIVVDDCGPLTDRGQAWFHEAVKTRLFPRGEIVDYRPMKPLEFDWGTQTGVGAEWRGARGTQRTATRLRKPLSKVTEHDQIRLHAGMIRHFAEKYHGFVFEHDLERAIDYDIFRSLYKNG